MYTEKLKQSHLRLRRAQGMVEYIIIVVVVGIFCIGIFMALGKGAQTQTGTITRKVTGSKTHDSAIGSAAVSARVTNEENRQNLMKGN